LIGETVGIINGKDYRVTFAAAVNQTGRKWVMTARGVAISETGRVDITKRHGVNNP